MEKALEAVLAWWEISGVEIPDMPKSPRPSPMGKGTPSPQSAPQMVGTAAPKKVVDHTSPAEHSVKLTQKISSLSELENVIRSFDAGEISDHARQSVFARGNPEADIMVIGEAPGRDEDIQGKPFVGRSGQLLDRMLASIGLSEENCYISNIVNWRPPQNRNPKPDEIAMCLPFIHKHIELVDPKIILMVGGISMSALTGVNGIMKNRGQWSSIKIGKKDYRALPIYHPAFLLRQPGLKKDAWQDLLTLKEHYTAL